MNASDKHWLNWINRNNAKQQTWAAEYLRKRGVHVGDVWTYEILVASIDNWPENDARLLVSQMKAAWNQKAHRDKPNGKQSVNFTISSDARNRLRELAKQKHLNMNEMLENLIHAAFDGTASGVDEVMADCRNLDYGEWGGTSQVNAHRLHSSQVTSQLPELLQVRGHLPQAPQVSPPWAESAQVNSQLRKPPCPSIWELC